MIGYHQNALLEYDGTAELARLCNMDKEDVLDVVLPGWRDIPDDCFAEPITWRQAITIQDEIAKVKK